MFPLGKCAFANTAKSHRKPLVHLVVSWSFLMLCVKSDAKHINVHSESNHFLIVFRDMQKPKVPFGKTWFLNIAESCCQTLARQMIQNIPRSIKNSTISLSYFATCEGLCFPQGKHDCNMAESCWRTHISLVVAWSCFNAWRERWCGTYREPLGIQHFLGCVSRRAKTIVSLRGNMLFERGEVP